MGEAEDGTEGIVVHSEGFLSGGHGGCPMRRLGAGHEQDAVQARALDRKDSE